MKKILIMFMVLLLSLGFASCKAREKTQPEKKKGFRENVVIQNNEPPADKKASSTEEPKPEPKKDTKPEELVGEMLYALQTGEKDKIQNYLDYDALLKLQGGVDEDWHFKQILKNMKYEVLSSEVDGGSASVWVKITNIDMAVVLPQYFNSAMRLEYDNALSEEPVSTAELEKRYEDLFYNLLDTHKAGVIERLADIGLQKDGNEWKILPYNDLNNVVLGGYFTAKSSIGGEIAHEEAYPRQEAMTPMQPEHPAVDEDVFFGGADGVNADDGEDQNIQQALD